MRDGIIPTVLGGAVTATGAYLRGRELSKKGMRRKDIVPMVETAVIGFGLAHILLGSIDLVQKRR